mmetsp:Transcript_12636/g.18328  ORF Transcript_12636/g.18328 Transcript_12636/m.18328 type:complete len:91 (-) Transcript_12636:334-606(-)
MVGIVCTTSSTCSRYKIVVLPALSRPNIRMRTSLFPSNAPKTLDRNMPIAGTTRSCHQAVAILAQDWLGFLQLGIRPRKALDKDTPQDGD